MASDLSRPLAAALLAAAIAFGGSAAAQPAQPSAADKETARALMDKGDEKMDAKDYASALKSYTAADAIMHLPQTGIAVARAQAAAGLLCEALDTAMAVARSQPQPGDTPAAAKSRAEGSELAAALRGRIPSIQVVVDHPPANLSVAIDGAALPAVVAGEPRKVNPGAHVVTVNAPGFEQARAEVKTGEGAAITVPITLKPSAGGPPPDKQPPPPPDKQPPPDKIPVKPAPGLSPLVFVGFGVGGASLIAGAVTGGLSFAKTSTLKGVCGDGKCAAMYSGDLSTANTLANVSNATIGIGLAGVALGVVGVVISKPAARAPAAAFTVEPLVGPGIIGARGTF